MTRARPFTKASLRHSIEAAHKAGLRVTAIRPDGTLIVDDGRGPVAEIASLDQDEALSKWEDVEP